MPLPGLRMWDLAPELLDEEASRDFLDPIRAVIVLAFACGTNSTQARTG